MNPQERAATIERLLQEGVDLFQAGMADHAVAVWTEVLHMEPDEPRALEYLRKAGVGSISDELPTVQPGGAVRTELEQLLAERRYEDALQLLYTARQSTPHAPEISRGIQLIKQRLIRRYLHQIGNLDEVPRVALTPEEIETRAVGDEELELVRLADGISSFGDIAQESRLGRFETYRRLAGLVARGVLVVAGAPAPDAAVAASEPPPAPAPRRTTSWLVGAVLAAAAAGIAVAVWQVGGWGTPGDKIDGAAAAAAAPLPVPTAPDALLAVVAMPDASAAAAAIEPAPPPPPPLEVHPPAPERKVNVRPAPRPVRAAVPTTPAPVAPRPPTVTPDAAPATAEPAPAPTPAPAPEPEPEPAPAKPSGPLDAEATTSALNVQGSLTRGAVERALVRIAHTFRACYATAALRAQRNAATAIQVSVTIDETGNTRDPSASGGALPGLDACVADAARRIRTEAPDVGVVHVNFTVTYKPLGP